jgi:signal peptidase II
MKPYFKPFLLVFLVLLFDQVLKIWIKTNMYLGQEFVIFSDWFIIHFTENNGMAFGMELAGSAGKLLLSIFRVIAIGGIGYGLYYVVKKKFHPGFITCVALVFAGALGNLIDSAFYGVIFGDSYSGVAEVFPKEGGYAGYLHGKVVDMLYFPLIEGHFPQWFPIWAGEEFIFFRPVFNIADMSISTGMGLFILFQNRYFPDQKIKEEEKPAEAGATENNDETIEKPL